METSILGQEEVVSICQQAIEKSNTHVFLWVSWLWKNNARI